MLMRVSVGIHSEDIDAAIEVRLALLFSMGARSPAVAGRPAN